MLQPSLGKSLGDRAVARGSPGMEGEKGKCVCMGGSGVLEETETPNVERDVEITQMLRFHEVVNQVTVLLMLKC